MCSVSNIMDEELVLHLIFGSISVAIYIYSKILYYWNNIGFPQIETHFFYGNLKPYIRHNLDFGTMLRNYYKVSDGEKYVGLYMIYKPALLLRDPKVIRTFFQNNFASFSTRKIFEEKEKCPLLDNLYQRSEDEWKRQRNLIANAFTAENIEGLYDTICVTTSLERYLDGLTERGKDSVHINSLMQCHLYNVMASVIFGTNIDAISFSEYYFQITGEEVFRPKFVAKLSFIRDLVVPTEWKWLHNLLNFRRHSKKVENFYVSLTRHILGRRENYRNEWNIKKDYMQYLMKIRNRGKLYKDERGKNIEVNGIGRKFLSVTQVTSQAFLAFTSGFPTILSTIDFFLLEVAKNCTIQNRLLDEIVATFESSGGRPDHNSILNMEYLDACVNETFRKYPPIPYLIRYCTNDYLMREKKFTVKKGMPVLVSVLGIHHDPTYYPDPMEFDPERFTPKQLATRPAISFIPFGFGPKKCIGTKLAKQIIKTHLVFILSKYSVSVAPEMRNSEIDFDIGYLNEIDRIYLLFERRMSSSSCSDG